MIRYFLITLFGIVILSITGCYTQLAVNNNDESEVYEEPVIVEVPVPILIIEPTPPPISPIIVPPPAPRPPLNPPDDNYEDRVYKTRNPQTDRPTDNGNKERIRNTDGRNNTGERGRK